MWEVCWMGAYLCQLGQAMSPSLSRLEMVSFWMFLYLKLPFYPVFSLEFLHIIHLGELCPVAV